jgi:dTMP kinase
VKKPAKNKFVVPSVSNRSFYGDGIPGVEPEELAGKLIAVEGADGSGAPRRSPRWSSGWKSPVTPRCRSGLKRSTLVSEELERAQNGNILSRTTLSLFYATDFADQMENVILPALKAGFIVLADRYIYTLMARDMVRGMDIAWLKNLYGIALKPDAVFYLAIEPNDLVQRNLAKTATLDYWESGMDLGLSRDLVRQLHRVSDPDADGLPQTAKDVRLHHRGRQSSGGRVVNAELRAKIEDVLVGK